MTHNGREVVTIQRACEIVGVTRRTIYNWIRSKRIETVAVASGATRIYADTLWRTSDGTPLATPSGAQP